MALGWSRGPGAGGGRRCINSAERENKKGMQKKFKRDMEGVEQIGVSNLMYEEYELID
jgi:hypothetical protein